MFRKDFVWGVASSAYQIEGREAEDGCGKTIWDTFTEEGHILDGYDAKVACAHMHRYKEDYAMMRMLGIKAYRFSVSWARILPEGIGKVNEKAITLYRNMILEMKRNGIEPYLTMYHWEFPQALQERGGWLNEEVMDWFAEYARVVAENFSDICEYFITLNEPECFVGLGHLSGVHAPGLRLPIKDVFQVAHNALRAHGRAVINLRKYACRPIQIGYAPTCGMPYPATDRPEDVEAARRVMFGFHEPMENWTWNVAWFNDPVFLGRYPEEGLKKFTQYLPAITPEDMKLISQPLDFMGQNIYNGYMVRQGENGDPIFVNRPAGFPKTAAKWPITPECIYFAVKMIYDRYKLPLYITENGMSCHDIVSLDGKVHDPDRKNFLDMYISALQKASDEGADVRGYFLWTFLDNFEWDKGYTERFGIVYVDFATQKRTVKDSAYWYQRIIESNGAELTINMKQRPILFFEPVFKNKIWGGNNLQKQYGYDISGSNIGECWAISAHEDCDCVVKEGPYQGKTLSELWKQEPALFGNLNSARYPLLVKMIDAKEDLSIQVHPDDAYAKKYENGSLGKEECWYVLDCPENASLIVGHNAHSRQELKHMIEQNRFDELLRRVPVKKGDFIQNKPGTLHAITGGMVILETQQSSDITYRVYDYERQQDGKPRELHIEQGTEVITVPAESIESCKRSAANVPENTMYELISCDSYTVWKLSVTKPFSILQDKPFMNMSVIDGEGLINGQLIKKGDHFILPSGIGEVDLRGNMQIIASSVSR